MYILRKIAGIILLLFAGVFLLDILVTMPNSFIRCKAKMTESNSEGIAYVLGSLFVTIVSIVAIFFIVKQGLKLVRKKKVVNNSIDEIGL
jgi:hypothetical protein